MYMPDINKSFCECTKKDSLIVCYLPITLPTSKVRIKRIKRDKEKRHHHMRGLLLFQAYLKAKLKILL